MSGYEISESSKSCPACAAVAKTDAVLCIKCGLNFQSGMRTQEARRDPADAQKPRSGGKSAKPVHRCPCGYDLTGLTGKPCPECGRTAEGRKKGGKFGTREERQSEATSSYWRATRLVFIIGTVLGLGLTLGVGMGLRGFDALTCLAHLGLCEASLFVGCFAICLLFIGFEEDVRGVVMRLIAVGAVWSGVMLLISMIPPIGAMMIIGSAVMSVLSLALLLNQMTGRDYTDSSIIAFGSWVLAFVTMIVISLMFAG